jgi:hypothetical protein
MPKFGNGHGNVSKNERLSVNKSENFSHASIILDPIVNEITPPM